jgi:hypothetical protein
MAGDKVVLLGCASVVYIQGTMSPRGLPGETRASYVRGRAAAQQFHSQTNFLKAS